jgi:hypothetical protein
MFSCSLIFSVAPFFCWTQTLSFLFWWLYFLVLTFLLDFYFYHLYFYWDFLFLFFFFLTVSHLYNTGWPWICNTTASPFECWGHRHIACLVTFSISLLGWSVFSLVSNLFVIVEVFLWWFQFFWSHNSNMSVICMLACLGLFFFLLIWVFLLFGMWCLASVKLLLSKSFLSGRAPLSWTFS